MACHDKALPKGRSENANVDLHEKYFTLRSNTKSLRSSYKRYI